MKGGPQGGNSTLSQVGVPGSCSEGFACRSSVGECAQDLYPRRGSSRQDWAEGEAELPGTLNKGLRQPPGSSGAERALRGLSFPTPGPPLTGRKLFLGRGMHLGKGSLPNQRQIIGKNPLKSYWQSTLRIAASG